MRLFGYKMTVVAQIGLAIVVLNLLVALFAPLDRALRSGDAGRRPLGRSRLASLLGLDNLGRDLLSRLIYGAQAHHRARADHYGAVIFDRHHHRLWRRGGGRLGRSRAVASRRPAAVDADADLRLRRAVGAGHGAAGADRDDRDPRFDKGVPSRPIGRDGARQSRIRRGREAARRRLVVDHHARDPAQRDPAADRRIRPALLLHLPVRRVAQLPRPRRAAAGRRLGQHGARLQGHDRLRLDRADLSRRRDRASSPSASISWSTGCCPSIRADREKAHERSFNQRAEEARRRHPRRPQDADPGAHRSRRRSRAGRRCLVPAQPRRGDRADRRIRRRQVDHRPRLDGLYAPRLLHRRRRDRVRRRGRAHDDRGAAPAPARPAHLLHRPERGGFVQSRHDADAAGDGTGDTARRAQRRRGAQGSDQPVQAARSARPRAHRRALSASGLRGAAAARDGGDGDGRPARHRRVRRADHRARRDDAGRVPRGVPQAGARAWRGRALHHPRPRRRRPDRRSHHGAQARQDRRVRRRRGKSCRTRRRNIPAASSPSASRRTASSPRPRSKSRRSSPSTT